jgi:hypothetical protein
MFLLEGAALLGQWGWALDLAVLVVAVLGRPQETGAILED